MLTACKSNWYPIPVEVADILCLVIFVAEPIWMLPGATLLKSFGHHVRRIPVKIKKPVLIRIPVIKDRRFACGATLLGNQKTTHLFQSANILCAP